VTKGGKSSTTNKAKGKRVNQFEKAPRNWEKKKDWNTVKVRRRRGELTGPELGREAGKYLHGFYVRRGRQPLGIHPATKNVLPRQKNNDDPEEGGKKRKSSVKESEAWELCQTEGVLDAHFCLGGNFIKLGKR